METQTAPANGAKAAPLVELREISIAFGGIKAVDHASVDLYPGEVVGLLGHNGAGKSTLIKVLSGAYKREHGAILIDGEEATINNPRDAKAYGIETIYQTLALADNVDAASNLFLGRELLTRWGTLDDVGDGIAGAQSDGPPQSEFPPLQGSGQIAVGRPAPVGRDRARHSFQCAHPDHGRADRRAGPQETAQVGELIKQLKAEGIGIFLISHDIHDVFDLADRVAVMKNGQVVGIARTAGRHQGRSARHDHPRQMPARRDSRPGRDGELRRRIAGFRSPASAREALLGSRPQRPRPASAKRRSGDRRSFVASWRPCRTWRYRLSSA